MRDMKDSGIEWIGEIPKDWNADKIKYHFSNNKIIVGNNADKYERLALTLNGVVKRPKDDDKGLQPEKFDSYQILKPNELVFKLIDLQNFSTSRIGLSPYLGLVSSSYIIISTKKSIVPSFAEKYFVSMWQRRIFNALGDSGVRSSLSANYLLNLSIVYPSIHKQQQIADFLDRKCSKINALRLEIEQEIATLKEYKKSIITEAVTKGLNKNVPMKDSGIEWIGKIPKEWEIIRGKYVLSYMQKPIRSDDGVITCFRDGHVTLRSNRREEGFTISGKEIGYQGIDVGDLVVHGMDGFAGAIGISDSRGKASPVLNVLNTSQNKRYIMYYLRSMAYSNVFTALSTGIRVRSCDLHWNKLAELPYPIPTQEEQQEIVEYIDRITKKVDSVIELKNKQLSTLDEYKKSLIYEYVTGKKEVPGV